MAPKDGPMLLREALKTGECLNGREVFDGISAKVATAVGFDFLYLTGATGSLAGTSDTDFARLGEMVVQNTHLPVIADADTGFGAPLDVIRTIRLYEQAGMAGCHIGDLVEPGQLQGTNVVDREVYLERIRSAVEARSNPDFAIIARTHVRQPDVYAGEEAGERGQRAFKERVRRLKEACRAGADIAFMESPRREEACYKSLVEELAPYPVMINVVPHGPTPEFMGSQRLIFGVSALQLLDIPTLDTLLRCWRCGRHRVAEGEGHRLCRGQYHFQQLPDVRSRPSL